MELGRHIGAVVQGVKRLHRAENRVLYLENAKIGTILAGGGRKGHQFALNKAHERLEEARVELKKTLPFFNP